MKSPYPDNFANDNFSNDLSEFKTPLWNPNTAANWSAIFTPILGAYLHAQNWKALGKPNLAIANMMWVGGYSAFIIALLIAIMIPGEGWFTNNRGYIGVALTLGWYFSQAKGQVKYVKETLADRYPHKSFTQPIAVGAVAWAIFIGLAFQAPPSLPSADTLASDLKPTISQSLQKQYPGKNISVIKSTLSHTKDNHYQGTALIQVDSVTQTYHLTADVVGDSVSWEIKPAIGEKLVFNKGELFFEAPVTQAEAQKLGEYLTKDGFFDGQPKTAQIQKSGTTYEFKMVVKKNMEKDLSFIALLPTVARTLSTQVFDGTPIRIYLCDNLFQTLYVLP